jgi:hypothetical protein
MHGNEHVLSTFLAVSTGNINHQDAQSTFSSGISLLWVDYQQNQALNSKLPFCL